MSRSRRPRRSRRSARGWRWTSAWLAGCLVVSCGGTSKLDMGRASREIDRLLTAAYDLEVTTVRCPEQVDVEAAATFSCTVRIAARSLRVNASQVDTEGNLRVKPAAAVLVMDEVRADLVATLAGKLDQPAEVDCGEDAVKVVAPRATFECTADDGGDRKTVRVRVRDVNGSLTYTLR